MSKSSDLVFDKWHFLTVRLVRQFRKQLFVVWSYWLYWIYCYSKMCEIKR